MWTAAALYYDDKEYIWYFINHSSCQWFFKCGHSYFCEYPNISDVTTYKALQSLFSEEKKNCLSYFMCLITVIDPLIFWISYHNLI
jgi:hypothetical protein